MDRACVNTCDSSEGPIGVWFDPDDDDYVVRINIAAITWMP